MRLRSLAQVPLLLASAHALAAQQPRVTVTLLGGQQWNSALFSQTGSYTLGDQEWHMVKSMRVPEATIAGARVTARVAGPWRVYADLSHGSSRMGYVDDTRSTLPDGTELYSRHESIRPARITTVGAGVGRGVPLPRGFPELELTVGGALQHFGIDRAQYLCGAPSQSVPCGDEDPWESSYTVTSAVGGLTLRQAITRQVGLELRSAYTIGRANTEGFYQDLAPEYDAIEAPRHQTVRTGEASLGIWVRP